MLLLASLALAHEAGTTIAEPDLYRFGVDGRIGFSTDDAITAPDGYYDVRLTLEYYEHTDVLDAETYDFDSVERAFGAHVAGGYQWKKLRIGAHLPLYMFTAPDDLTSEPAVGDLALDVKYGLLDPRKGGIGFAPTVRIGLPTGGVDSPLAHHGLGLYLGLPVGTGNGAWRASFVPSAGILLALDPNEAARQSPQVSVGAGVERDIGMFAVGLEATAPELLTMAVPGTRLAEATVFGRLRAENDVEFRLGASGFLEAEREQPGARVLLSVGYAPALSWDKDGDGLEDQDDKCPAEAEDKDGFQDDDGCPDPDNDQDGIPDENDTCPLEAEDKDEWQDDDGCPDLNTKVTVHFKDDAGTPITVGTFTIGDKTAEHDASVEVPGGAKYTLVVNAPEYLEKKAEIEIPNGKPYELRVTLKKAPPPKPSAENLVVITKEKIEFYDKIYFDTNKATIQAKSNAVLDAIAKALVEHPEIQVVRVEGHTDKQGSDRKNLELSQQRADSVRAYLLGKGVAAERLVAKGWGETKPVDPADTPAAYEANRRVEFVIEKRGE
jgi:outer membrane protein OmpA-like peptidoglycan-associated protein